MVSLQINEAVYHLSDDDLNALLQRLWLSLLSQYEHLDERFILGAHLLARSRLEMHERQAIAAGYAPDQVMQLRPPQGGDPVLHLSRLYLDLLEEGLRSAKLSARTDGTNTITALSLTTENTYESGRQLAFSWTQG